MSTLTFLLPAVSLSDKTKKSSPLITPPALESSSSVSLTTFEITMFWFVVVFTSMSPASTTPKKTPPDICRAPAGALQISPIPVSGSAAPERLNAVSLSTAVTVANCLNGCPETPLALINTTSPTATVVRKF